ncbi:nucleotidyltransferase family protein [Alphaproteobacteria bacterium KMM 3653]|uniref:Nucleotidyltransferase family protein n=1 Tax=Harenicola maris TaxID=2841044 RepID=A0AAP2CN83_9RHOB|nr:nucleotidyltransferase family protein [Harenicola maris]
MRDLTVLLLAAGLSRRMGAQNKLLLPIGGMPMIRHMVETYSALSPRALLVVTGHDATAIEAALKGTQATCIHNPDYAKGQASSVAAGLRAAGPATGLLIGLGDQPLLTIDDLRSLLWAHSRADPARISIPKQGEQRGNPILVPGILRPRLLADPAAPGCKKFTRSNPEHVQFHALPALGFYADVDTPEAYRALKYRPAKEPT